MVMVMVYCPNYPPCGNLTFFSVLAACIACGNFIKCFPTESKSHMSSLYPLFYENLNDNIPSVRHGAAIALANIAQTYGNSSIHTHVLFHLFRVLTLYCGSSAAAIYSIASRLWVEPSDHNYGKMECSASQPQYAIHHAITSNQTTVGGDNSLA